MARITVEKCLEHVPSRFDLILLASGRARQLSTTSREPMVETNNDKMEIKISLGTNNELEIGFFDKGKPVDGAKVRHRNIDDVKPGGLGTFFIQQIMDAVVVKEGEKPWINHLVLTKNLNA